MAATRLTWVLACALSLLVSSPVLAGPKPSKEEFEKRRREAQQQATHVVTGRVKRVYETTEKTTDGDFSRLSRLMIVEFEVATVEKTAEKGDGLRPGPMYFQEEEEIWGGGQQAGGRHLSWIASLPNLELRVFAKRGENGLFLDLWNEDVKPFVAARPGDGPKPVQEAADAKEKDEKASETAEAFIAALKAEEIGSVIHVCDVPFLWDGKDVVKDWDDLLERFESGFERQDLAEFRYKVEEILTYPKLPKPLLSDEHRRSLARVLDDGDRIVVISMKGEKLAVLVHWKNGTPTVVGFREPTKKLLGRTRAHLRNLLCRRKPGGRCRQRHSAECATRELECLVALIKSTIDPTSDFVIPLNEPMGNDSKGK